MSKKSILYIAVAFAFALLAASAMSGGRARADVRRPLAFQQGRADAYTCPSPAPSGGTSGSIVTGSDSSEFFSNVNCPGGKAFLYHGRKGSKPIVTALRLVAGAASLRALDVDSTGETVGVEISPKGVELPYKWNTDGEPTRLASPNQGVATAVGLGGSPVAGEVLDSKGYFQAYRFSPTPETFIEPTGYTVVYAVNGYSPPGALAEPVYVGEVAGRAAVAVPPDKPFAALNIGLPDNYSSAALGISEYDYIVGSYSLPKGACGSALPTRGFGYQYPNGPATYLQPLSGDCSAEALAVDDAKGIVGYSSAGTTATQSAYGYDLPNFPSGYVDLNTATKFYAPPTWATKGHRLIKATGIDTSGDITATDSAGVIWFLYFPAN